MWGKLQEPCSVAAKLLRPFGLQAFTARGGGSAGQGDRSGSDLETTGMGYRAVARGPALMSGPSLQQVLCGAVVFLFDENLQATGPPGTQIH